MAVAKLLLLLVMGIGRHYVSTAPNARPPAEQLRELRGLELVMPYVVVFGRALSWIWTFLEGCVLFALSGYCPPVLAQPILQWLLPASVNPVALTTLTPTFLAGAILMLGGTLLRGYCFYTLGSRFTFELAIRPGHALVTDGVYSIVRHPSYTGAFALSAGWLLWVLNWQSVCVRLLWAVMQGANRSGGVGGSGDQVAGFGDVVTALLACTWMTMMGLFYQLMDKRMDKEDAMLEKSFGNEWRVWAKNVPYRLVPGVY